MRRQALRTEVLLAIACAAAAIFLIASELMDTFHLTQGGEDTAAITALSRHHGAMFVLAIFALLGLVVAVTTGARPAAYALAACGVIALLIFLITDLPKANSVGSLGDQNHFLFDAKAEPRGGFWLELVGSLLLSACGAALATLPADRLRLFDVGRQGEGQGPREVVDWSKQT